MADHLLSVWSGVVLLLEALNKRSSRMIGVVHERYLKRGQLKNVHKNYLQQGVSFNISSRVIRIHDMHNENRIPAALTKI